MTICIPHVLIVLSGGSRTMNVLSCHILIVQTYYISVVATHVSLFILVWILKCLQIIELSLISLLRAWNFASNMLSGCTMNTWQFFGWLSSWPCRSRAIHTQLMAYIAHILGCSEIREHILHILIVISRSIWSQSSLIVNTRMRSLHAHTSDTIWWNEIKTEFARFNKLHIAYSRASSTAHLLLAGHNCRVTVYTIRIRFTVLPWVQASVRVRNLPKNLLVIAMNAFQIPKPHTIHAALCILLLQTQPLVLRLVDVGTWKPTDITLTLTCSLPRSIYAVRP